MSKLENKRRRAASKGFVVMKFIQDKYVSEERGVTLYNGQLYRRKTHVYAYKKVADAGPWIVLRADSPYPLSGLTYRQAIQLAYMLAFRRKGF
jgi:hypothetical protein